MVRIFSFRLIKLACFCVALLVVFRTMVVLNTIPHLQTQGTSIYLQDFDERIAADVHDQHDAAFMPRNAHLDAIYQQIKYQNKCQAIERPREILYNELGSWQRTNNSGDEVLVYSSFYDDRPAVGLSPTIRIMGVSTTDSNLYCHIWYDDIDTPFVTKAEVIKSGRGDKMHGIFYGQYLFSCSIPGAHPVPTYVSVSIGACNQSTIYLPVFLPIRAQWKVEFGVCVAISYGNINSNDFIEWMELNNLIGVKEVHIYNGTLNASVHPVFDLYKKEKRLFVHSMPPPKDIRTKMGSKLGSPASLNDCMLRFMYRYRYILVIDFDEVVVPRTTRNLHELIKAANKKHQLKFDSPIYTFSNTYFYTNFDRVTNVDLKTIAYQKSMPPSPKWVAPKSMVDPRRCLSVFNHYCYVQFPEFSQHRLFLVNDTLARSHHYKPCPHGKAKCMELAKNTTLDDTVLKYQKVLSVRVKNKLNALQILR